MPLRSASICRPRIEEVEVRKPERGRDPSPSTAATITPMLSPVSLAKADGDQDSPIAMIMISP